ncbi:MAG: hypothetical protein ABSH41_15795, partial [Syntrophobacteraceae bacterium]
FPFFGFEYDYFSIIISEILFSKHYHCWFMPGVSESATLIAATNGTSGIIRLNASSIASFTIIYT